MNSRQHSNALYLLINRRSDFTDDEFYALNEVASAWSNNDFHLREKDSAETVKIGMNAYFRVFALETEARAQAERLNAEAADKIRG